MMFKEIILPLLLLLTTSSFGASVNTSTTTTNQRPPLTVNEWASSIWGSFSSKVEVGWNKVANETSKTFNKVSSDVKDGWDQLANNTAPTFKAISSNIQDDWDVVANSTTTTFQKAATDIQDGWEMVSNKTVTSYKHSTSRISFVFNNLYCPSNKTIEANSTFDDSYDDGPAFREFSCMAIKVLKVIGISILGGLGVVITFPIAFILVIGAIGFTGSGRPNINFIKNIYFKLKVFFFYSCRGVDRIVCCSLPGSNWTRCSRKLVCKITEYWSSRTGRNLHRLWKRSRLYRHLDFYVPACRIYYLALLLVHRDVTNKSLVNFIEIKFRYFQ